MSAERLSHYSHKNKMCTARAREIRLVDAEIYRIVAQMPPDCGFWEALAARKNRVVVLRALQRYRDHLARR